MNNKKEAMLKSLGNYPQSEDGPPDEFKNHMSVYAYYKGTAFPMITGFADPDHWEDLKSKFHDVLTKTLRSGVSLQKQGQCYKEQMEQWEKKLVDMSRDKDGNKGTINQEVLAKTTLELGFDSTEQFQNLWYMNVHNLLKLGIIKDNDMFGFLIMGDPTLHNFPDQADRLFGEFANNIPPTDTGRGRGGTYGMIDHDPSIKTTEGASTMEEGHSTCCMEGQEFVDLKTKKKSPKKKGQNNKKKKKSKAMYINARTGTMQELPIELIKDDKLPDEVIKELRKKHHASQSKKQ